MNAFESYVALVKGYCALVVLVLPRSFSKGGFLFSPLCLLISGIIQCFAATRLVASAIRCNQDDFGKLA